MTTSRLLAAALLFAGAFAAPTAAQDPQPQAGAPTLPDLKGPNCVGKTAPIVLTDTNRKEIFSNETEQGPRQFIVQAYYPTAKTDQNSQCLGESYATPAFSKGFAQFLQGGDQAAAYFQALKTHSVSNATMVESKEEVPLLLFSPGLGGFRLGYQALIEEMVSHGYIVVAMDHPFDAAFLEFPDGKIITQDPRTNWDGHENGEGLNVSTAVNVRIEDSLFLLQTISKNEIKIPGLEKLPTKIGMFGHSLGGQLSLNVMLKSKDVLSGINMDGSFFFAANATANGAEGADCKRPFMTMVSDRTPREQDALTPEESARAQKEFEDTMRAQSGPKVMPLIKNSEHHSYSDLPAFLMKLKGDEEGLKEVIEAAKALMGTADPAKVYEILTTYLVGFFDSTIKSQKDISAGFGDFPEVKLIDINAKNQTSY